MTLMEQCAVYYTDLFQRRRKKTVSESIPTTNISIRMLSENLTLQYESAHQQVHRH